MARRVLVAGATSAIAHATLRLLARDGDRLFLVGRDADRLRSIAEDLNVRGAERVDRMTADLADTSLHEAIVERAERELGELDTFLLAYGILGDGERDPRSVRRVQQVLHTNLVSATSLLTVVGARFESRARGTIVGISSVAGDRGRQSNYVYGASKAGLSAFLQGMRNRLHPSGVRVVTINPGFVDTPMTAHLPKSPLFASPEQIAQSIHRSVKGRGPDVVYTPWYWRLVMGAVRAIPEPLFKRLKL